MHNILQQKEYCSKRKKKTKSRINYKTYPIGFVTSERKACLSQNVEPQSESELEHTHYF